MSFVLYPPTSSVAFSIFDYPIKWYGLFMACAIFLCAYLSYLFIKKVYSNKLADDFIDLCPGLIISGIIGARFFYCVSNLDFYLKHKSEILMLNHGGLCIYGAIIFGILYFIFYFKKRKIDKDVFLKYLDSVALFFPLAQSIGRWGNFFNQEAFGIPANGFLKLYVNAPFRPQNYINYEYFHPTFLYEGILDFISFILLLIIFIKFKNKLKQGMIFYLCLIFYSIIRFFVESIRIDSVMYVANIAIAQVIALLVLVISCFLFVRLFLKH